MFLKIKNPNRLLINYTTSAEFHKVKPVKMRSNTLRIDSKSVVGIGNTGERERLLIVDT